jgi:hypothetical protein
MLCYIGPVDGKPSWTGKTFQISKKKLANFGFNIFFGKGMICGICIN